MQNLQHPATSPQAPSIQTPAEKLSEAQMLVSSALSYADDEANDFLSWADREQMSRRLSAALRLMREAKEAIRVTESAPFASCVECGAEDFADTLTGEGCQLCAYQSAVSLSN